MNESREIIIFSHTYEYLNLFLAYKYSIGLVLMKIVGKKRQEGHQIHKLRIFLSRLGLDSLYVTHQGQEA